MDTLRGLVDNFPPNWFLEGQIEEGVTSLEEGQTKLHAQLRLKTEHTRGSKIVKYFNNAIHLEITRNKHALHNYVHKDDTRVAEFKTVENRSPQWRVVRDKFADWVVTTQYHHSKMPEEEKWRLWDEFIGISLEEGMEIDLIGVNPQYRSCINKYWNNIINMAINRQQTIVDNCPDRQNADIPVVENVVAEGGVVPRVKRVKKLVSE